MAGFFWVIVVLSVLGLLISWSGPYTHAQNEQTKASPAAQNEDAERHVAKESESESSGWRKYKEKIERNEKFITATSTIFIAAFTVLLAFATFFLWSATRDLVNDARHSGEEQSRNMKAAIAESARSADAAKEAADAAKKAVELSDKTAERQLRAYVILGPLSIVATDIRKPVMNFRTLNVGLTPARNVRSGQNIRIDRFPPREEFYKGNMQSLDGVMPDRLGVVLGQNQFHESGDIKFTNPLTDLQLNNIRNGIFAIYISGVIEYEDMFGKTRRTRFCMYTTGDTYGSDPRMRYTDKGNDVE